MHGNAALKLQSAAFGRLDCKAGEKWKPPQKPFYSKKLLDDGRRDAALLERGIPLSEEICVLTFETSNSHRKTRGWGEWDTPLDQYSFRLAAKGFPDGATFEDYLGVLCRRKPVVRVLDIGMGTGRQWLEALGKHGQIELYGTVLDKTYVVPQLQERVAACSAGVVDRVFPANFFDVVVSHYGFHDEEGVFLAPVRKILKIGGEAILTNSYYENWMEVKGSLEKLSGKLATISEFNPGEYFFHLKRIS